MLNSQRFIIPGRPTLTATILDGNKIRDEIQSELLQQIADLKRAGVTPGLAAVLVGENPASQIYVRSKVKTCEALGLYSEKIERSKDSTTEELLELVNDLNHNDEIDGILVQLPLPPQVDTKRVLMAVDPAKDVDGFHPVNVGNLVAGRTGFVPCTPAGIMEILKRSKIPLKGARAVVIGRSDIVGKPVAMLLLHEHATVTICHSRTRDLPAVAREADILVAAMGKPAFVTARLYQTRRDRHRRGNQPPDDGRGSAQDLPRSHRPSRHPAEARRGAGGGCATGRRAGHRRRLYTGAGRRWTLDHRDAHVEHHPGRAAAAGIKSSG